MHDRLKARYVIECSVETLEPLHVGGGEVTEFATVDNPVLRVRKDGSEIPVIPGSSIKGVLRAHFSRIFNSLSDDVLKSEGFRRTELNKSLEEFEREFARSNESEKLKMVSKLGTLEKFFGISGLASPIRITDAEPENNTEIQTRTHIKIDPATDRVEKGKLFSVEFVQGKFRLKIVFDELDGEEYEDVNRFFHEVFVKSLQNGLELHIGGMKSRGYGLCLLKMDRGLKFTPQKLAFGEEPEEWG